jgi:hypothetical protein
MSSALNAYENDTFYYGGEKRYAGYPFYGPPARYQP